MTIYCIETNETFKDVYEVAQKYSTSTQIIIKVCNAKIGPYKGMSFEFTDDVNKQEKRIIRNNINRFNRSILCIDNGKKYRTTQEASKDLNIGRSSIMNAIIGRSKKAGGMSFVWIDNKKEQSTVNI